MNRLKGREAAASRAAFLLPAARMPGAALLLASLMAIASCSGASVQEAAPREDESPAWALEEGFLALALNEQGSLEPFAATEKAQSAPEPLPFALQRAVATLDSHDGRLYVALNRIGIDTLSLSSSDGRTVVRRETAYGADTGSASGDSTGTGDIFSSRSAGSFLRLDGELSLFLYRHPFFESVQEEGPGHAFVKAGPGGIGPSIQATAPYSLPEGITGDIFALYPQSTGEILFQTREQTGERVVIRYGKLSVGADSATPLDRRSFEALLAPKPIAEAPGQLATLAAELGGALLVETRFPDASTQSYYRGRLEEAMQCGARIDPELGTVLLAPDGRGAYWPAQDAGTVKVFSLAGSIGLPGIRYRDPVLLRGALAFVWEEDQFPAIGRSGVLIMEMAGLGL